MKKHTLATLAALMAATASAAYADDTNYWGAPQTSNGSVNITNYWGIAPSGDASSGGSNSNTDWINAQPDATGASAQNDDWLAAGGQSDDALLKVSTRAASSDLTRASSADTGADTPALTRAASGKAAGTDATDATGSDTPSNATWVQTYPEPDNATWVKTYPDHDETASVDINGNANGSVPTCLDINGSEYCTGTDTASSDGSDASSSTPLMRAALPVDTTELTGDEKLACEALLCLSAAAARPSECTASLTRLFSIVKKKPHKTARARADFLSICPKVADDEEMQTQIAQFVDGEYGTMSWDDYSSRHGDGSTSLAKSGASEGTQTAGNGTCTEAEKGTYDAAGNVCNGVYWTGNVHWDQAPLNPYCMVGSQPCIYSEAELAQRGMQDWVLVDGRYFDPKDAACNYQYVGCGSEGYTGPGLDTADNGTGGTDTANKGTDPTGHEVDTASTDAKTWPAEPAQDTVSTTSNPYGMSIEHAKATLLIDRIQRNSGEAHRQGNTRLVNIAREVLQNASGPEADEAKRTLQANGVTLP